MNELQGVAERLLALAQRTKRDDVRAELCACATEAGRWAGQLDAARDVLERIDATGDRIGALRRELGALVNAPEGGSMVEVLETAVQWVRIVSGLDAVAEEASE
jgi:hypothetical protein